MIGGGIAGLAAAWELRNDAEVTVFEPGRLGGRIRTTPFSGHPVEEGPDAFITRQPDAARLAGEVGLGDQLVAPAAGRSMLWHAGRLRPLPDGLMLGVPTDIGTLLRSRILSPAGLARAAMEPLVPRSRHPERMTVRQLIGGRFGSQVADRLVDPLIGGISAGSTAELAAAAVAPQLVAAAQRRRSLLLGLRHTPDGPGPGGPGPGSPGPVFLTIDGGLGRLVEALVGRLEDGGVRFRAEAATRVAPAGPGMVAVSPQEETFDGVVVATPAAVAADLLWPGQPSPLRGIPTSSVAIVTAAIPGLELPPGFNGFLVPRHPHLLMTACSFASNKWPHWADPGTALVRLSCGRRGDERHMTQDDAELTERLLDELGTCLGSQVQPAQTRVSRWPDAFPQFVVGHRERVGAAEGGLARSLPSVALAGASYSGVGLPACIASGRAAAARVRDASRSRAGTA